LQEEFDVAVDWRGFELHPETPPGGLPRSALVPPSRAAGMHEYLRQFAARFGIADMAIPDHIPNTRRALAIAEYARDQGRVDAFRHAAMDAHWRRGENLENPADLGEIATRAGLEPKMAVRAMDDPAYQARVDALRAEAGRMGVTGIPTFFIGDAVVVGCQPVEVLADAVRRARARPKT
jgi:predicted DsbA family dithiol-disulfide isomerase